MGKANSKKLSLVAVLNCITYSKFKKENSVCTLHLSRQDIRQWCNDLAGAMGNKLELVCSLWSTAKSMARLNCALFLDIFTSINWHRIPLALSLGRLTWWSGYISLLFSVYISLHEQGNLVIDVYHKCNHGGSLTLSRYN